MLAEAMVEATDAVGAGVVGEDDAVPTFTLRHVRLTAAAAAEFAERLHALAIEFSELPRSGDVVYGLIAGIYPTTIPTLRDRHEEDR